MPWIDVFGHLHEIVQSKVGDLRWAITAASYAHMEKSGRNSVEASLKEYESVEVRPGRSSGVSEKKHAAYDAMPDEARLLSIGSSLSAEGLQFLDRRLHHREWLAEKGISPEDARLRYTEWRAERDAEVEKRRAGDGDPVGGDD